MKGLYSLFLELPKTKKIEVGSLGPHTFERGTYIYVGSAMNGIEKRVERHCALFAVLSGDNKPKRWHIDYLLPHTRLKAVLIIETDQRAECELNEFMKKFKTTHPVKGFGSSDCSCFSHLHLLTPKQAVYNVVESIPEGKVTTYKTVSELTGLSPREVGRILSQNYDPSVPCHRVIRSDLTLGGYNRGRRKKHMLLMEEGVTFTVNETTSDPTSSSVKKESLWNPYEGTRKMART